MSINKVAKKHKLEEVSEELVHKNFGNNKVDCAKVFFPNILSSSICKKLILHLVIPTYN